MMTFSSGYAMRVGSRTGIEYRDAHGRLLINSERTSAPWFEVVVYTRSIPDVPARPRAQVLDRLERAFAFVGWRLTREDA